MKNIYKILEEIGVNIPDDKKKEFDKELSANYKTINEVDNLTNKYNDLKSKHETLESAYNTDIKKRDEDLSALKEQLEAAGADVTKLKDVQSQFDQLKTQYADDKKAYETKLAEQQYEFLVKEKVSGLKFSSNAAKKDFTREVIAKKLPIQNEDLLGFDDFVKAYKEADASAFIVEEPNPTPNPTPAPTITTKSNNGGDPNPAATNLFGFHFSGVRPKD